METAGKTDNVGRFVKERASEWRFTASAPRR